MKLKERAQKVWNYAKEHPVKAALIVLGTTASVVGTTVAIKNRHSHDSKDYIDNLKEQVDALPEGNEEFETEE